MQSVLTESKSSALGRRSIRRIAFTGSLAGLVVLAAFPILASVADLVAISKTGIPSDHEQAFQAVSGMSVNAAQASASGLVHYVSLLETGYSVHELVFGILFLAIVIFALRHGAIWAWFACMTTLIADLVYTFTFGSYSETILRYSLIADIGLPVLLVVAGVTGVFGVGRRVR